MSDSANAFTISEKKKKQVIIDQFVVFEWKNENRFSKIKLLKLDDFSMLKCDKISIINPIHPKAAASY